MAGKRKRESCPHCRRKDSCVICNPCPHGILKHKCPACNPDKCCEHGQVKSWCYDAACNGCPHNNKKADCRQCNGCECGKLKRRCLIHKPRPPPSSS
jgi:hypothetical protein